MRQKRELRQILRALEKWKILNIQKYSTVVSGKFPKSKFCCFVEYLPWKVDKTALKNIKKDRIISKIFTSIFIFSILLNQQSDLIQLLAIFYFFLLAFSI